MRILIANDEFLFADMLEAYLAQLDHAAVEKVSSLEAVADRGKRGTQYDLLILDTATPGMNGLSGLVQARESFPKTPIVLLSGSGDPQIVRDAFRLGAAGFLPRKTMRGNAMLNALRLMLAGDRYIPSSLIPDIDPPDRQPVKGTELGEREMEVIRRVKAGYPNKRIAAELGISHVTVGLHLSRVFRKIGARNRTDAVRILTERGLL